MDNADGVLGIGRNISLMIEPDLFDFSIYIVLGDDVRIFFTVEVPNKLFFRDHIFTIIKMSIIFVDQMPKRKVSLTIFFLVKTIVLFLHMDFS